MNGLSYYFDGWFFALFDAILGSVFLSLWKSLLILIPGARLRLIKVKGLTRLTKSYLNRFVIFVWKRVENFCIGKVFFVKKEVRERC